MNMSIPLGVVDITLEESVALFEGILTGQRQISEHDFLYRLIDKIYYKPHPFTEGDRAPILVYSSSPKSVDITQQRSADRTISILNSVVENGTGRRLKGGIQGFPLFGKTGTTNQSMNAAFCGVVPARRSGRWSFRDGVFISSYIGFDIPKSMRKGRYGVSGASGALPIWKSVAEGVIDAGLLGRASTNDSWNVEKQLQQVTLDSFQGFRSEEGGIQVFEDVDENGESVRYFSPTRIEEDIREDLMDFRSDFAYDADIDILIPKEN